MVAAGVSILRLQATGIWRLTGMERRNPNYLRQSDTALLLNFENYTMTLFTGELYSIEYPKHTGH